MKKQPGSANFPILGVIFLVFLTLKLAGIGVVATWSWWAVTSPLWGGFLFFLAVLIPVVVVAIKEEKKQEGGGTVFLDSFKQRLIKK